MALSPEVQASIIKVAGNWASEQINYAIKLKKIDSTIENDRAKYFHLYYRDLVNIVELEQGNVT